jgi:8-oxo-dGTP pyrophosphatase MutT (NUDIX family)
MSKPAYAGVGIIFRTKHLKIGEQTYGSRAVRHKYEYVINNGSVITVALTDDQRVVIIDEFRVPIGKLNVELPGGGLDGDKPLRAAKRELQEETGITGEVWRKIATINPMAGGSTEEKHIFLATSLDLAAIKPQAEEEISTISLVPYEQIISRISSGHITDGPTITALMLTALELGILSLKAKA